MAGCTRQARSDRQSGRGGHRLSSRRKRRTGAQCGRDQLEGQRQARATAARGCAGARLSTREWRRPRRARRPWPPMTPRRRVNGQCESSRDCPSHNRQCRRQRPPRRRRRRGLAAAVARQRPPDLGRRAISATATRIKLSVAGPPRLVRPATPTTLSPVAANTAPSEQHEPAHSRGSEERDGCAPICAARTRSDDRQSCQNERGGARSGQDLGHGPSQGQPAAEVALDLSCSGPEQRDAQPGAHLPGGGQRRSGRIERELVATTPSRSPAAAALAALVSLRWRPRDSRTRQQRRPAPTTRPTAQRRSSAPPPATPSWRARRNAAGRTRGRRARDGRQHQTQRGRDHRPGATAPATSTLDHAARAAETFAG